MTKQLSNGEKLVLATMNFAADAYLEDPSLEGVMLWSKTPKSTVKVEIAKEEEATRQSNLAKYIAQGYAFQSPQGEEVEDDEYTVEV